MCHCYEKPMNEHQYLSFYDIEPIEAFKQQNETAGLEVVLEFYGTAIPEILKQHL